MRRSVGEYQFYGLPIRLSRDDRHNLSNVINCMVLRCYDSKSRNFKYYGGRGIIVCKEWYDNETSKINYKNFIWWASNNGYKKGLQIDRINVDGNYQPDNCRWVTRVENGRNKRNNRLLVFNGESHPISYWTEKTGISFATIKARMKLGWSIEKILTTPVKELGKKLTYNGESKSMKAWSLELNIPYDVIKQRLNKLGWSVEESLSIPISGVGNSHLIAFNGVTKNMNSWAKEFHIPFRVFQSRFLAGWDMNQILSTPPRKLTRG